MPNLVISCFIAHFGNINTMARNQDYLMLKRGIKNVAIYEFWKILWSRFMSYTRKCSNKSYANVQLFFPSNVISFVWKMVWCQMAVLREINILTRPRKNIWLVKFSEISGANLSFLYICLHSEDVLYALQSQCLLAIFLINVEFFQDSNLNFCY